MDHPSFFIAVAFAVGAFVLIVGTLVLRHWWDSRSNKFPLTKRYLRPPGEFLRVKLEEIDSRVSELLLWLITAAAFVGVGVYAFLTGPEHVGVAFVVLAVGFMIYAAARLQSTAKLRRDCYLGFLGERAVGEELNQLMIDGWSVFHDVEFDDNPGAKSFNVDHVVVGPGGLFAIETKTRRKRKGSGGHEVTFNGQALEYPWGFEDYGVRNSQERAHYLSQWLSKKLQMDITATTVLVLTGWYVRRTGKSGLAVINDSEIPTFFRDEHKSARFKPETVASIRALLDERCRDVGV
ncbi:MAG: NERD domain-containing protein [Chthoniobacterales bacterium]|nr:NERD domain-containing protein [Chthoniobacterales bacterium]